MVGESQKKVLFVAECVTLAHMARPAVLATGLAEQGHEVYFASSGRYSELFPMLPVTREKIESIGPECFLRQLAKGKPLYDEQTLTAYVEEDLALLERLRPDVVVGDFRLSLSVSARRAGVPYITISNVYWSPFARQGYPVPELPINKVIGVGVAQVVFNVIRPLSFALHSRPMNAVRKRYGLSPLGTDLRRIYTDADITLYADLPGLVQTENLPSSHRFIGPVLWSAQVPLPDWWEDIDDGRPVIYLTPGSSGRLPGLGDLAAALADLPASVIVATAGKGVRGRPARGVYTAEFLPGEQAAARADLVVCNGGSPTTWQALAAGAPVVGLPSNLDQHLNMQALEAARLGRTLRSEDVAESSLRDAVVSVLRDEEYRRRALRMRDEIVARPPLPAFLAALEEIFA